MDLHSFFLLFPSIFMLHELEEILLFPRFMERNRNCNDDFYRGRLHLSESMQSSIRNSYSC